MFTVHGDCSSGSCSNRSFSSAIGPVGAQQTCDVVRDKALVGVLPWAGANALDGCTTNETCSSPFPVGLYTCDSSVSTEDANWGAVKSLYR